jgi:hypothetical protein
LPRVITEVSAVDARNREILKQEIKSKGSRP